METYIFKDKKEKKMSKKTIFILFVLSFFVGFMTREMINGMSGIIEDDYVIKKLNSNPQLQNQVQKYLTQEPTKPVIFNQEINLEVKKIVNPPKVLRGYSFDFFVIVSNLKSNLQYLNLDVYLVQDNSKQSVGSFNLQTLLNSANQSGQVQLGPIKINTNESYQLGKYKLELILMDSQKEVAKLKIPESQGEIEIVSYN